MPSGEISLKKRFSTMQYEPMLDVIADTLTTKSSPMHIISRLISIGESINWDEEHTVINNN